MDEDVTQRVEECVEEDWTHQSLNIFLVEVWQIMVLAIVDGLAEVLGEGGGMYGSPKSSEPFQHFPGSFANLPDDADRLRSP